MKKLRDIKVGDVVTIEGVNFLVARSHTINEPFGSPHEHWEIEFTNGGRITAPAGLMVEYPPKVNK